MLKKLFDFAKLQRENKIIKEKLKTIKVDIDSLIELMEHPVKRQRAILELLNDMKELCKGE